MALRADLVEQPIDRGDELLDALALERGDDVVVVDAGGVELVEQVVRFGSPSLPSISAIGRRRFTHQMRHFLTQAQGAERTKAQAVVAHLREGGVHGAEHGIADLLGIERD